MIRDVETLGDPPAEPQPGDCCGTGCARCVWDVYYDALADWESKRTARAATLPSVDLPLRNGHTTPLPVATPQTPSTSAVGSVVVRFVDSDEADDDFGVSLPSLDASANVSRLTTHQGYRKVSEVHVIHSSCGSRDAPDDGLTFYRLALTQPLEGSSFSPGDVVELLTPNAMDDIEGSARRVCNLLSLSPGRVLQLKPSPFVAEESFPSWLPTRCNATVEALLSYCVDLTSCAAVQLPLLRMLDRHFETACGSFGHASNPWKSWLDGHGAINWRQHVARAFPSVADVLEMHRAALQNATAAPLPMMPPMPPLARFLECAQPLQPRKFSIVRLSDDRLQVDLCVRGMVHSRNSMDSAQLTSSTPAFVGHTTRTLWQSTRTLHKHLPPMLLRGVGLGLHQHLPSSLLRRCNVWLFGAGSGVAPLLSLLSSRTHLQQSDHLVVGFRNHAEARCCAAVLRDMNVSSVASVNVVLSRESEQITSIGGDETLVVGSRQVAVQLHRHTRVPEWMVSDEACARQLREAMRRAVVFSDNGEDGAVVACGPAAFLQNLRNALRRVLSSSGQETEPDAEALLRKLEADERLVWENWQ